MKLWRNTPSLTLVLGLLALGLNSCSTSSSSIGSYNATRSQGIMMGGLSGALAGSANGSHLAKTKARAESDYTSRPGLGTQAGSQTYSSVQSTTFFRKSVGAPDAVDSFHYNDEEGAKAMLGGADASIQKHSGQFSAANKMLSVSLVDGYDWDGNDPFPWMTSRKVDGHKVVVGTHGSSYSIHLENKTKNRIEVVASVDGIDVMDGKSASVSKHGYVLAAGQKLDIKGFRQNNDNVKRFQFGSVRDSAAAKQGASAARNVGVIGLAVWQEDQLAAQNAARMEAMQRTMANPFGGPVSTR